MARDNEAVKEESERVHVAVRVRPYTQREEKSHKKSILSVESDGNLVHATKIDDRGKVTHSSFVYDNVFWSVNTPDASGRPPADQVQVYEAIGRPLVRHAFNGFNSCLFAYGQTGSGKTHTMMGTVGGDAGVIPRICVDLFATKRELEAPGNVRWMVEVGYVEVYNERVSDLLGRRKKGKGGAAGEEVFVEVREHPVRGVFIEGQRMQAVASLDDVLALIEAGNEVRHTAATKMNDRSSRSHAIFMLCLREERTMRSNNGQVITTAGKSSRMNLVDLAGSERVAQSQVEGQQFTEARYINLSLTTLGRVIDMLADMAKDRGAWSTPPYRESKLTYILKDSLGGNSKTFMIATVSPSVMNYEETMSTLRYASRARDIVNVVKMNEDPRARRIRELEEQMEAMRGAMRGGDPEYVSELEEKLLLMEAEAQKRAADLQALQLAREQHDMREKLLKATEAEKQDLQSRADELERQVKQSREQAEYQERMNQQLREEQEKKEHELLVRTAALTARMQELEEHSAERARLLAEVECLDRDRGHLIRCYDLQLEEMSERLRFFVAFQHERCDVVYECLCSMTCKLVDSVSMLATERTELCKALEAGVKQLQERVAELEGLCDARGEEISELWRRNEVAREKAEALEAQTVRSETDLKAAAHERGRLEQELMDAIEAKEAEMSISGQAERACRALREELAEVEQRCKEKSEEADGLREEVAGLSRQADTLATELGRVSEDAASQTRVVDAMQNELLKAQRDARDAREALETVNADHSSLLDRLESEKRDRCVAEERAAHLAAEVHRLQEHVAEASQRVSELEEENQQLAASLRDAMEERERLEAEAAQHRAEKKEVSQQLGELNDKVDSLHAIIAELSGEVDGARESRQQLSREVEQLRRECAEQRQAALGRQAEQQLADQRTAEADRLRGDLRDAAAARQELQATVDSLRTALAAEKEAALQTERQLEQESAARGEALAEVRRDVARLQQERDDLEAERAAERAEHERARSAMVDHSSQMQKKVEQMADELLQLQQELSASMMGVPTHEASVQADPMSSSDNDSEAHRHNFLERERETTRLKAVIQQVMNQAMEAEYQFKELDMRLKFNKEHVLDNEALTSHRPSVSTARQQSVRRLSL